MSDLFVYAIVIVFVLWLCSDSRSCSAGVEVVLPVVLPVVTLPVIANPWLDDIIIVPATASIVTAPSPQLLLAPAVDAVDVEPIGFMESLMAIADPAITPSFDHLSLVQLRSLGRFHQIKGASRWKKAEAIAALSAA